MPPVRLSKRDEVFVEAQLKIGAYDSAEEMLTDMSWD